jgi:hypothetical protein
MTTRKCVPFWTNQMPLEDATRGFSFRLMLACMVYASSIAMQAYPARAMFVDQTGGSGADASLEAVEQCGSEGGDCTAIAIWVDPASTGVSSFHLALSFDPTKFAFDPRISGPFCGFSAGGACPPSRASLGTSLIRQDNTTPGIPPPGFILHFDNTETGNVVVDYSVPTPVDLSTDMNVFALGFDFLNSDGLPTTIPADVPLFASYFGTPGAHQFNQTAFSCNGGATPCAGQPAIVGVDIATTIPEPTSAVILGIALAMFGFARTRKWRSSFSRACFALWKLRNP